MEADPRKLFERLFGQGDTAQERKAIAKQYSSILDLVTQEAADLRKSLDASDRAKLGDYLESVREIERRGQKRGEHEPRQAALPQGPAGAPVDPRAHPNCPIIAASHHATPT